MLCKDVVATYLALFKFYSTLNLFESLGHSPVAGVSQCLLKRGAMCFDLYHEISSYNHGHN